MRKLDAVRAQVLAVEALRALRKFMSGKGVLELLANSGVRISAVDLSRYVTGAVLPSPSRSREVLRALAESNALSLALKRVIVVDERGVVNVARIAYDTAILSLAGARAYVEFEGVSVTKVLTAAVNGVPLASWVSRALEAGLCVAKQEADASVDKYLEVKYFAPEPPRYASLYLPSHALREGDGVLIVDDLLCSGRTLEALIKLVKLAKSSLAGVFALVALRAGWSEALPSAALPSTVPKVLVALELSSRQREQSF